MKNSELKVSGFFYFSVTIKYKGFSFAKNTIAYGMTGYGRTRSFLFAKDIQREMEIEVWNENLKTIMDYARNDYTKNQ
jgi:hypothetical protein